MDDSLAVMNSGAGVNGHPPLLPLFLPFLSCIGYQAIHLALGYAVITVVIIFIVFILYHEIFRHGCLI